MPKPNKADNRKTIEYRVIAGNLKGRRVVVPDLGVTRPPLTRLRRSIFDFLNPYLDGASYLDLFSGTGSYLFEAASRGVSVARGVEREEKLAGAINHFAAAFGVSGCLCCDCADVFETIPAHHHEATTFDLIMMAPPQYIGLVDQTLAALKKFPLSPKDGLILCQHDTAETSAINWHGFAIHQQRKYGNTTFTVLQPTA